MPKTDGPSPEARAAVAALKPEPSKPPPWLADAANAAQALAEHAAELAQEAGIFRRRIDELAALSATERDWLEKTARKSGHWQETEKLLAVAETHADGALIRRWLY